MPPELFSSHLDRPRFVPENTPQPTNLTDEPELLNLKRLLQERGLFTEKIGHSLTHKDLHELWQCLNLQKPEGAHDTHQRDIQEIIHRLSTNEPVTDWQSDVQALKEQARHADHQTISAIETAFASALTAQPLLFRTLVALGELSHFSVSPLVTPALSLELGRGHNRISKPTFEHISLLNRLNTPESRLALHKLCDFFERLIVGMQNDETLAMIDYSAPQTGHNHLLFSISRFVTEEKKHTTNFLSHHHLTLVSEIHHSTASTHPEAISGIDGGATNAAIYHYRHLADIATNRAQLGITQGNVMSFPIVKLAPGYYASYPGGKIRDIFAEPSVSNRERFSIDTPALIARNNPDDEWVYETLNTPVTPAYPGNWNNNNLSLYRLDDLRDFFAVYEKPLAHLWEQSTTDTKNILQKMFFRLHSMQVITDNQLNQLGLKRPALAGPFSKNLENMRQEITNSTHSALEIANSPELAPYVYPVIVLFGSKLKGYGSSTADDDWAVFVKPEATNREPADLGQKLHTFFSQFPHINGSEIVQFWLEKKDQRLAIRDNVSGVHVGQSWWTHVLFGAAWEGDQKSINELKKQLLPAYMHDQQLPIHGRTARGLYLEELERDTLQYRLMHKGYANFFPEYGGLKTPHADSVDGQSMFWDSGYRQLATQLFINRVFLPKKTTP